LSQVERISQAITGDKTIKASIEPIGESTDYTLNCSGAETEAKFVFVTASSIEAMRDSENQVPSTE